jgi:hypothetical protein
MRKISSYKPLQNNFFVGFIIDNKYYIIDSITNKIKDIKDIKLNKINFIECSKDLIFKIKAYQNITKKNNIDKNKTYNIIYGAIEKNIEKKINRFKIIDKSVEEDILTKFKQKSKRSIITGRICSTYQVSKLNEIRQIIGLPKYNSKRKVDFYCEEF